MRCRTRDKLARLGGLPGDALGALDDFFERRRLRRGGESPLAWALLTPALAFLVMFALAPLAGAVYMSMFDYGRFDAVFAGLGNYTRVLGDPAFRNSVRVTVWYTIGVVPPTLVLSFAVAFLLRGAVRGRGLLRTVYFLPYVTSTVAAAMVWRVLFRHPGGVANTLLERLGLPAQQWLIERDGVLHLLSGGVLPEDFGPSLALCCVILFDIWHGAGFMVVIWLAGLTAIPRELEEAARIDGAGPFQRVWRVVLPLLSPTLFFLLVVGIIRALQAFNSFYALTQNPQKAPFHATQNIILFVYDQLYRQHNPGYGAAAAVLFTLAIVVLTLVQWRFIGRRVYYA
ncbi:MAG: carbohydrate ABC transporter permease [Candidatus Hydrogenedentota bacterium]